MYKPYRPTVSRGPPVPPKVEVDF